MKRTFIAIRIEADRDFEEAVYTLREGLSDESIKWIDSTNLHITLAFIGDTDDIAVKNIKSMLRDELSGFGMIEFGFRGFGVFRNFRDPRIIFADVENHFRLSEAFGIVKNGLNGLGIKLEERDFRPHLTIGRIRYLKDRKNLQELIDKFREVKFQDVNVSEIIYYESILQHSGPVYVPLEVINLNVK